MVLLLLPLLPPLLLSSFFFSSSFFLLISQPWPSLCRTSSNLGELLDQLRAGAAALIGEVWLDHCLHNCTLSSYRRASKMPIQLSYSHRKAVSLKILRIGLLCLSRICLSQQCKKLLPISRVSSVMARGVNVLWVGVVTQTPQLHSQGCAVGGPGGGCVLALVSEQLTLVQGFLLCAQV